MQVPIRGAHFRPPAKTILAALPAATPLLLEAEPENPHDENAIKVLIARSEIPRETLSEIDFLNAGLDEEEFWADESPLHLCYIGKEHCESLLTRGLGSLLASLAFDHTGAPMAEIV